MERPPYYGLNVSESTEALFLTIDRDYNTCRKKKASPL
jgi:hypothetical protein